MIKSNFKNNFYSRILLTVCVCSASELPQNTWGDHRICYVVVNSVTNTKVLLFLKYIAIGIEFRRDALCL